MAKLSDIPVETRESVMAIISKLARDQRGAGTIEYSLVAALIAVAAIGGYQSLGGGVKGTFNNVGDKVETSL